MNRINTGNAVDGHLENKIINFIRKKDFRFLRSLGFGGCGRTVLLEDEAISELFVCKKYEPFYPEYREVLYQRFVQEIKILYKLNHPNIVRVFNYYLYPDQWTGYILMEFVQGEDIKSYLARNPQDANEVFLHVVKGFAYLEQVGMLHRDIRPHNILVTDDAEVKIIDFGFGKNSESGENFEKSVSLNYLYERPEEFRNGSNVYTHQTEVYFVGKLFEDILLDKDLEGFSYKQELSMMCQYALDKRTKSFSSVLQSIMHKPVIQDADFSEVERWQYKQFSEGLFGLLQQIESNAHYDDDLDKIQGALERLYKKVMLEEYVENSVELGRLFIHGTFMYRTKYKIEVAVVKEFIDLLRGASREKKSIILANIQTKLDGVSRFEKADDSFDIPF